MESEVRFAFHSKVIYEMDQYTDIFTGDYGKQTWRWTRQTDRNHPQLKRDQRRLE